jgi:ATP-dependent Clp protease ATP-binding subunit ClpA
MFERFTHAARDVVVEAGYAADELGAPRVGAEHLLLALASADGLGGQVLAGYGVTAEVDALRSVGIDADEVFRRLEETFGVEALGPVGPSASGRRRRLPFTPEAKEVLETSLREALALKHRYIGTEHLLLGLLVEGSVAHLLAGHAVTHADARGRILAELRRTA